MTKKNICLFITKNIIKIFKILLNNFLIVSNFKNKNIKILKIV